MIKYIYLEKFEEIIEYEIKTKSSKLHEYLCKTYTK